MKMFVISDNNDTYTGMRLVGIDGVVVHTGADVIDTVEKLISEPEVGIILYTEVIRRLAPDYLAEKMTKLEKPLFLEIPDRHGSSDGGDMAQIIRNSIGVKID